jgi:hypothetical protein
VDGVRGAVEQARDGQHDEEHGGDGDPHGCREGVRNSCAYHAGRYE